MSNTAIQPTEQVALSAQTLRAALALAVLSILWVTLTPFSGGGVGEGGEVSFERVGRPVNQIGFSVLAAIVLAFVVTMVDRRVIAGAIAPLWLVMAAIVAVSGFTGPFSEGAWRSVIFSLIAAGLAVSVVILPASQRDFDRVLAAASLIVLGLSFAGLALDPNAAIHQAFEAEAQHAGLWRGLFPHKNLAGPVMVMIAFGGIYLMRRGMTWTGLGVAALAVVFALNAGSRTALALAPVVIAIVLLPAMLRLRPLAVMAAVGAIIGAHALTIGTVYVPALDAVLRAFHETTTFTGRTVIWDFAGDYVLERPWAGYGFAGFWGSPVLLATEQPFDSSWDPRGIIHGHNGFLDAALSFGLPGLFVLVWLVVFAPALDYIRACRRAGNAVLADYFFMIVVFCVLTSALESFYFRRADPIWITMVMALAGLRVAGRLGTR